MSDSRSDSSGRSPAGSRAAQDYESRRSRTAAAYAGARDSASRVTQRAGEQINANPVAAVAGGFAVGALLAAVLPRTEREAELLGGVGNRINDVARGAARSAADAGRQQVEEITSNAATKVGEAVIGAVAATTGAGDKS